ncbi:MAG TPA: ABC transporter substrate-binding protein [Candidatus Limnocylindria bacterium]|nr:ABC transporter substrate-binding protein [Candidatus Limnocylindria bacterium]
MRPRGINLALVVIVAVVLALAAILLFRQLAIGPTAEGSTSPTATVSGGSGSGSGELRKVKVLLGFQPDVQFAPFYLAQQAGYFRDAGLDVTIDYSDDVLRLVADGRAQLGVADATDVMIGRTSGIPIKYVATLYRHFPVAVIGAPGTLPDDPAGLAGLRIGTPGRFGSSWHALLALLRAGGLTKDDVSIREYPQFNQVQGLLRGDVDLITGFVANEPLRLKAQGFDSALLRVDDFAPLPGPGLVAGDELLASDPGLARDFAAAVLHAQRDIAADVGAGVDAAVKEVPAIGEDRGTARAVLTATVGLWAGDSGPDARIDAQIWQTGYATMRDLGFIDGSVPVTDMYDPSVATAP